MVGIRRRVWTHENKFLHAGQDGGRSQDPRDAYVGLAGAADPEVWRYAFAHDFAVVTMNARDFLTLAAGVTLHPGLIALRESGLTRDEQWARLAPS